MNGDSIAAQFSYGALDLVITHYDYFDGVSYWFYIIDKRGRVRDVVSTPDYFGFLENLRIDESNRLSFGFHGTTDRWAVSLSEQGYWSFGTGEMGRRLNSFILSKRHLTLSNV